MLFLFYFNFSPASLPKAAPLRKKEERSSQIPPPFLAEVKTAIKSENPEPNNQMSLDKQLINVFSSPPPGKRVSLKRTRPPPLLKRTKNAISRPRSHLQTNVIFQFWFVNCPPPPFHKVLPMWRTNRKMCVLMVYWGEAMLRGAGGEGSCYN